MFSAKEMKNNPEVYIKFLENAFSYATDKQLQVKSDKWKERGSEANVRSSAFGRCVREAYYAFFLGVDTEEEHNRVTKEKFLMGHIAEDNIAKALLDIPGKLWGIEEEHENMFPVHIDTVEEGITFSSTTDFVKEVEDKETGEMDYYPLELKTTQKRTWDEGFRYDNHHLLQLMNWVYNAKARGLNVPYANLLYVKNLYHWWKAHDTKIVTIPVDTAFHKIIRVREPFHKWQPFMEKRRARLVKAIKNKELPRDPIASGEVPKYLCNYCDFKPICWEQENITDPEAVEWNGSG